LTLPPSVRLSVVMDVESDLAHRRELELLLASRGVRVPEDRFDGVYAVHQELARLAALLRQPRDPESAPASVFDLGAVLRADPSE
jgi:hypothetical protein